MFIYIYKHIYRYIYIYLLFSTTVEILINHLNDSFQNLYSINYFCIYYILRRKYKL